MEMFYKKDFRLGDLVLSNNFFYAPLAGCTDLAFRKMSIKYFPGLLFCEMVKIEAVIRHDKNTFDLLDFTEDMHPIGAQLCGSNPMVAKEAAKIIEDLGFDVIDFNCGCPVDKVTKDGSGSAMLKNPEKIGEMLSSIMSVVKIPITLKIRCGWDNEQIYANEIVKIAKKAGAKAVTIHGRTKKQGYRGLSNWDHIKSAKDNIEGIPIIGNGDVFSASDAKKMFEYTNCDGIMISRGTLGQPWIMEDIFRLFNNLPLISRTGKDVYEVMLNHFKYILEYQIERKAILDMRRVGCWYLKRCKGTKKLRFAINQAKSTSEIISYLNEYLWEEVEFLEKNAREEL